MLGIHYRRYDGSPKDNHIIASTPDVNDKKLHDAVVEMRGNCIKTAEQYRFEPAIFQGKPVQVEMKVQMIFQID